MMAAVRRGQSGAPVWSWVAGVAFVVGLVAGGLWLWSAPAELLDRGDKLGGIVGGLIAVVALVVSVAAVLVALREWRAGEDPAVLLDRAVQDVARWALRQWEREASVRLLDRPAPLRVRWGRTARNVVIRDLTAADAPAQSGQDLSGDVTTVTDRYTKLVAGQLVVLGRPAAGKSALALLLTLGLLRRRVHGDPVPVLLTMSSWNPGGEDLDDWLVRRLSEEFPALADRGRYGPQAVARLVYMRMVLPVLDGLDEMPPSLHAVALTALNDALAADRPAVVLCRTDTYEQMIAAVGVPLGRAEVVELSPVDPEKAAEFLQAGQIDQQRWLRVVEHLHDLPDGPLAQVLSSPLMVYLARTIYTSSGNDPDLLAKLADAANVERIEAHLLDAYVPALYARRSPTGPQDRARAGATDRRYTQAQARLWLGFLAQHMTSLDTLELGWWQLIHAVRGFRYWYGAACFLLFGTIGGLTLGMTVGVVCATAFGLGGAIVGGLDNRPRHLKLGAPKFRSQALGRPVLTNKLAWATSTLTMVAFMVVVSPMFGVLFALAYVIAVGLSEAVVIPSDGQEPTHPRALLHSDRRAAVAQILVAAGTFGIFLSFVLRPLQALMFGLMFGIGFGLDSPWLRYSIARSWLALRGKLPWQPMRFLHDAHRRGALRQIGATYQLRHARLQQHLTDTA